MDTDPVLLPTGHCWCGCGESVQLGSFFAAGHNKNAVSAVVIEEYGSEVSFLVKHGYGPGGRNAYQTRQAQKTAATTKKQEKARKPSTRKEPKN